MSLSAPGLRVLAMIPSRDTDLRLTTLHFGFRAPALLALVLTTSGSPLSAAESVGLSSVRGRTILNTALPDNPVEATDRFGWSFATGDFNGDGVADLATGAPYDDQGLGQTSPRGSVFIRLGTAGVGLGTGSPDFMLSDASGVHFGWALAAGDFDGDLIDDLAVGSPEGIVGFGHPYGFVRVYYGSTTPEVFGEAVNVSNVGIPLVGRNGFALAAGHFDADAYADLAIGSPGKDTNAGAVRIAYGSASGLTDPGPVIEQSAPGVEDTSEAQDLFGYSLVAGDFDGNGHDDLAVGVVNENQMGAVQVFFSTGSGLDPAADFLLSQNLVAGTGELNDQFGFALAAADFDGDGKEDLAIGSPGEAFGISNEIANSGMVVALYGSTSASFDLARTQAWGQGGILGLDAAEAGDRFSATLAAGDFDADGYADLAIGQPEEDVTGPNDGALTVHMGSPAGFSQARARFLAAGTQGLPGPVQTHSNYGFAAAAGDFDGDGFDDLAIGIPYYNIGLAFDAGCEVVLYGSTFADGFESQGTGYWPVAVP
jgi:hypothetical protein